MRIRASLLILLLYLLRNPLAELLVHFRKHLNGTLLDPLHTLANMSSNVRHKIVIRSLFLQQRPELAWLLEVLIRRLTRVCLYPPSPLIMSHILRSDLDTSERRPRVVRIRSIVAIDGTRTITLVWGVYCTDRLVARQLLIIRAESVALRIWVREHAGLEHDVRAGCDARRHGAWREGGLFDLCDGC